MEFNKPQRSSSKRLIFHLSYNLKVSAGDKDFHIDKGTVTSSTTMYKMMEGSGDLFI
jgi:hypothetical protein